MLRSGLVSITFRQLAVQEVIRHTAEAGLEGIEWGGDVHVPPGDVALASEVGAATRDAGLVVAAYGSYYRIGESPVEEFGGVLRSAAALGTSIVRVWIGGRGSAEADAEYRKHVAKASHRAAEMAADAGITLACEWHGRTLTDTPDSAAALFEQVDHPAFCTYWQPHVGMNPTACLADLQIALPRLVGLHVYQWEGPPIERHPLAEGEASWKRYLSEALRRPSEPVGPDVFALLEFVQDDEPAHLQRDARTLRQWVAWANTQAGVEAG